MERRSALKSLLAGVGTLAIPRTILAAQTTSGPQRAGTRAGACWVTPETTQGPYYFDPALIRQDIRELETGVLLTLAITVIDEHCFPQPGVLVDVWHCDKDGLYSGYNQPGGNTVGQTFLRGTQITDVTGVVHFTTIYPGWYPGRATHIHFKVRTSTVTYSTSQFAFPESANAAVYASPLYVGRGQNPVSNQQDGIFHNPAPQYLTIAVTGDPTNGYAGTYTIGLEAAPTDAPSIAQVPGLKLTGWPAPFREQAILRATLPERGFVTLAIYDTLGRRLRVLTTEPRPAGAFEITWDGRDEEGHPLPAGVYMASLEHDGRRASTRLVRVR